MSGATNNSNSRVTDQGLRCLSCDYNLTGAVSNRCPECGASVNSPKDIRLAAPHEVREPPWEAWPWFLKPLAFPITAVAVAFLPQLWARRFAANPRLDLAMVFYAFCIAIASRIAAEVFASMM